VHVTDRPRTFLPSFSATRDDNIWHPDLLRLSLPSWLDRRIRQTATREEEPAYRMLLRDLVAK
jgi:hypothetical protein